MYKVLHIIKSLGRGGAEMLLPETLRVHDRARFDFAYVYFLPHKDQMAGALREQGAPVKCFSATNPATILLQAPAIAKFAKDWGADLIHSHLPLSGVVSRVVGKLTGIPIVYTEHNKQERYHPVTRKLNVSTMGWNAKIFAVSDNVLESIYGHWKHDPERVESLLNGVNTNRFDPRKYTRAESRLQLGISPERPVVGTVCVFRSQKRLQLWLELAAKISEAIPNAQFVILGDGPEEDGIKALANKLLGPDKVLFPGRLEEVRPWLAAMDVYLMTSEFEGLPIAMLEAMSMELPVVTTLAGGIGEVVRDGTEGYTAGVDAWRDLADPVIRLLSDDELRKQTGALARQRVIDAFSIERMASALENHYTNVLR